ncbi:hypothetical protein SAMN05445756_0322 [Kytococcus aerolatus]|uniref:DUF7455 domain-containing protein n=1 Tax=Kytococcus aerolatus TaxID=592308 RepID=A0A212T455_9MICO|nr:hypothetical protein [Kytococcus aerolatus]SNC60650.1 hypothetical protein SAMN05445756_0322 [Kytococcus aerolatus]
MDTATAPTPTLTPADRCDRCGARAYLRATVSGTHLLFCAHHGQAHLPALRERSDVEILDETHQLQG